MSDSLVNLAAKFKIASPENIDPASTIVVIEDQQDQRLILVHHLNKLGYNTIRHFASAQEAYAFLKGFSGELSGVISSYDTESMTAVDLLVEIQENPNCSRPPFAVAILNPSKEKIMLATETGVDEILVKPYTIKDFMPKIKMAFRKFHNPRNPEKVYELAKKCLRDQKFKEATAIYSEIANASPESARPWVGMARAALGEEQVDKALEHLKAAEEKNPHFVHTYVLRGQIFTDKKDWEQAIAAYKQAIDLSPLNPVRYEEVAEILFKQKKFEEAIELLSIAIKNELNFPKLHHYLSQAYFSTRDFKAAIKHIRQALGAEPDNVTYLNQLGISYKESEQLEEALKVYNSIIKLDQENLPALYNKAILLKNMEKVTEAIKLLERIIKKDPTFEPAVQKLNEFKSAG